MNEELALALPEDQSVAKYVTEEDFQSIATSSKFLPRLQLFGSNSEVVKEGKVPVGVYGIVNGDKIEVLGNEIRAWVISMRLKAMRTDTDPIVAYYDPKSEQFQKIKAASEVENQGPLCGPEFLIYLPNEKKFVTFFMCSKTMRREAPNVKDLLKRAATFKITLIKNAKFSWHGPVVTACSVPLPQPDLEVLREVLTNFNNPPETEVEVIDEKAKAATSRDR